MGAAKPRSFRGSLFRSYCKELRRTGIFEQVRSRASAPVKAMLDDPRKVAAWLGPEAFDEMAEAILALQPTPEQAQAAVRNRNMTARLAWNPYLCNPALEPRLRRINIATLVVWGKQDRIIPLVHGELYAKRIAGAKLVVIDQCGHVPPVEQPDEFARIVGDFLAE